LNPLIISSQRLTPPDNIVTTLPFLKLGFVQLKENTFPEYKISRQPRLILR
jgi:hypothetical protein